MTFWILVGVAVWVVLVAACLRFFRGAAIQERHIDRVPF